MPAERGPDGNPNVGDFLVHDFPVILDAFTNQPLEWFHRAQPDLFMLWSDRPATVYDYIVTAELRTDGSMTILAIDLDPGGSRP